MSSSLLRRKENNGNDPTVNLVGKSGGWGASSGAAAGDDASKQQHERAIPAQPSAAWGGAGLPEERKKQVGRGRGVKSGWVLAGGRRSRCLAAATLQARCCRCELLACFALEFGSLPRSTCNPHSNRLLSACSSSWRRSRSSPCWVGQAGSTTPTRGATPMTTTRAVVPGMPMSAAMQVQRGFLHLSSIDASGAHALLLVSRAALRGLLPRASCSQKSSGSAAASLAGLAALPC